MSLINRTGFLQAISLCKQAKRFRGKINLRRPRAPHFEKAQLLAVGTPYFPPQKPKGIICDKYVNYFNQDEVENKLQRIIAKELYEEFTSSRLVVFYHLNPMTYEQHFKAQVLFKRENMDLKNYGKKTLQMALEGTPYEIILEHFQGHNMLLFCPEPKIKQILKINRRFPQILMLYGVLEGKYLSKDELVKLSNIPNLQAAQAELVYTLNCMGGNIVNQLNSHQQNLVAALTERAKQLEEKKE